KRTHRSVYADRWAVGGDSREEPHLRTAGRDQSQAAGRDRGAKANRARVAREQGKAPYCQSATTTACQLGWSDGRSEPPRLHGKTATGMAASHSQWPKAVTADVG